MTAAYTTLDVPVEGGTLRAGVWPGGEATPIVVAAHGITANHLSFAAVARQLAGDVTLVAPDLRGRGRSNRITGPFGIGAHAADLVRLLDHLDVERTVVVGHSMGAWVAATTAARHPDRVAAVVLVDGGFALPGSVGADVDVDDVLATVLGPALARLSMTFVDRDAYRAFWQAHPAVGGRYWNDDIAAYVDYDLVGEPPELRSSVSPDAVRADGTEQLVDPSVRDAAASLVCPVVRLFAPRGLLDGDPLYPVAALAADDEVVPDTNHYTIVLGPGRGPAAVADAIRTTYRAYGPDR